MEIKPTDLLAVVRACVELHELTPKAAFSYRASEEVKRRARLAVSETFALYLKQIVEENVK